MIRTTLVVFVMFFVIASQAHAYTDQGTAHVQLAAHAQALANGRIAVSKEVVDWGANPKRMWNDNGAWGAHLFVEYIPLWNADNDNTSIAAWDCLALSPSNIYCEQLVGVAGSDTLGFAAIAPSQRVPDINVFYTITEGRAEKKAERLRAKGAHVPDDPYFTNWVVDDAHNSRIRWHVTSHEGDFTIDYWSDCTMRRPRGGPTRINCSRWREEWF